MDSGPEPSMSADDEPGPIGTEMPGPDDDDAADDDDAIVDDDDEPGPVGPDPSTPIGPQDPCATVECSAGQRCESDGTVATCVNNTCDELACSETEVCRPDPDGGNVCVDNSCNEDVDCAPEEHCAASGICEDDVCTPGAMQCDGQSVYQCSSGGGGEEELFLCQSPAYFESMCAEATSQGTGCTCEDDWDCPGFTTCEVGVCLGTGKEPTCTLPAVDFADTPPTVEIHWGGDSPDNDEAHDGTPEQNPAPWPEYSHVEATPLVINLDDDNGDGLVDELDFPEIVFVAYEFFDNGIVRAIHGGGPDKGKDFFASCGGMSWQERAPFDTDDTPCPTQQADMHSQNAPAAGDLDGDGLPEIVYVTNTFALRVLNRFGEGLLLTEDNVVHNGSSGGMGNNTIAGVTVTIANLDNEGFAEIIVGRDVFTLNYGVVPEPPAPPPAGDAGVPDAGAPPAPTAGDAGTGGEEQLYIEHHFRGTGATGRNGRGTSVANPPLGPTACVADVHSGPGQEILAGTTLYRMPERTECAAPPCEGELEIVWDGASVNEDPELWYDNGYCAIADIWGADPTVAPGPDNPQDGVPEAILIADGWLQILDVETGLLIHQRDLGGGAVGGAPNVDDFDGDGFMEVASALESFYVVVDLQEPTDSCPAWPDTMDRVLMDGVEDNPNLENGLVRDPGGACTSDADCADASVCNVRRGQCVCLHNGWQRSSDDASSRATSSSVFDFNGDGAAEVLYNDECEFRVYDGVNGEVLYNELSRSRTALENPVVADVDNDGNAEAVTILNTEVNDRCDDDEDGVPTGPNGLRVWGDPLDTWVSARRIWNQFSYHVTNVTESGAIPIHPPESWKEYNGRTYNTYRSQPRNFGVAPDLVVNAVSLFSPDVECGQLGETLEITFEIENAGDLRVGPGVEVSFFGTWDGTEAPLQGPDGPLTFTLQNSLEPGRSLIGSVTFDIADQGEPELPTDVRVEVDTGGADGSTFGAERECIEDNNDNVAPVEPGEPRPDLSIQVGEAAVDCSERVATVEVTVTNSGTTEAVGVVIEIFAGDPNSAGAPMQTVTLNEPIAAMDSVTLTIEVPSFPINREIILWGVVDRANAISECNEGDNSDPADNPILCPVGGRAR